MRRAFNQKISNFYYMFSIVVFVSIAFLAALVTQIILWRVRLPRNHFKMLLIIFGLYLMLGILGLGLAADWTYSLLFVQCYGVLALSYISFYSLIEGESPSLVLVMAVYARRKKGLTLNEANQLLASEDIMGIRLQELERDKLIWMSDQGYQLTPRGHLLGGLFHCGRLILHLDKGG
jgi:hypothetical protein